jgi:hypothetical protein
MGRHGTWTETGSGGGGGGAVGAVVTVLALAVLAARVGASVVQAAAGLLEAVMWVAVAGLALAVAVGVALVVRGRRQPRVLERPWAYRADVAEPGPPRELHVHLPAGVDAAEVARLLAGLEAGHTEAGWRSPRLPPAAGPG